MVTRSMSDQYAVLGNPIKHSLSPKIHASFAAQTGQDISYEALEAPVDGFTAFVGELHKQGFGGLNVTLPFKEEAAQLAESLSERAQLAAAVNTLIRTENGWQGDNTDGAGILRDLTHNLALDLTDKRILLVGAGGASRGVVAPLLSANPALLHIVNRTAEKATALATHFQHLGVVSGGGLDSTDNLPYDLVINATSASLSGKLPELNTNVIAAETSCYDMMYSKTGTAFMQWAEQQGAQLSVDGLGMLVEQAAESFSIWRGIRPDTTEAMEMLR